MKVKEWFNNWVELIKSNWPFMASKVEVIDTAHWLRIYISLKADNKFKSYKCVRDFLSKGVYSTPVIEPLDFNKVSLSDSPEVTKFAKQVMSRWIKCDDVELYSYLSKVSK